MVSNLDSSYNFPVGMTIPALGYHLLLTFLWKFGDFRTEVVRLYSSRIFSF